MSCVSTMVWPWLLWEKDGFASTIQINFRGTRQIFQMYHTEVSCRRGVEVKRDWEINTAEGEERERGERGKVWPACLPGWQLTLLDVTFTVCWRFVWKPSHLWLAVWLMSLSACLCSLRRGHGLIPGITDLFAFRANLQISHTLKYKSEHLHTFRQTHVRTPWYAYSIQYKLVHCICTQAGVETDS